MPRGDPAYLRAQAEGSLRRLGLDRFDLWQLHTLDPNTPRAAQFAAVARLREDGLARHVGLSNVTIADIKEAAAHFPVATVQNRFNFADRVQEGVLRHCEAEGIGFIPWYPLAAGDLSGPASALAAMARARNVAPGQLALAWPLRRSPVILPIPGTAKVAHLEENVAAAGLVLNDEEFAALDGVGGPPG